MSKSIEGIKKYGEVYVVLNEYMDYINTSGHDGDGEFTSGQVIKPSFRGFKAYVDKMSDIVVGDK